MSRLEHVLRVGVAARGQPAAEPASLAAPAAPAAPAGASAPAPTAGAAEDDDLDDPTRLCEKIVTFEKLWGQPSGTEINLSVRDDEGKQVREQEKLDEINAERTEQGKKKLLMLEGNVPGTVGEKKTRDGKKTVLICGRNLKPLVGEEQLLVTADNIAVPGKQAGYAVCNSSPRKSDLWCLMK